MAAKSKLFKVHLALHLEPYDDDSWAEDTDRELLPKSERQKIHLLKTALQNKYKSQTNLRKRLLEHCCMDYAHAYFTAYTNELDYEEARDWFLLDAAFDPHGLGLTLIIQITAPRKKSSQWTSEKVKEILGYARNSFSHWNEGVFEYLGKQDAYHPVVVSASLERPVVVEENDLLPVTLPDVILGIFQHGPKDVDVTEIRPTSKSKQQFSRAVGLRSIEDISEREEKHFYIPLRHLAEQRLKLQQKQVSQKVALNRSRTLL